MHCVWKMKFHLITLILALVTAGEDGQTNTDIFIKCTTKIDNFLKPVTSFLSILHAMYKNPEKPFKIFSFTDMEVLHHQLDILQSQCPKSNSSDDQMTCYMFKLLENFKAFWKFNKESISLWVESESEDIERSIQTTIKRHAKDVCSSAVVIQPCKITTALSTSNCRTLTTERTTSGTTITETTSFTTSTENRLLQSQNAEEKCAKSSDIIIASVCSFVGGLVCSMVLLLFVFRRRICTGTKTHKPTDEGIILNDDIIKPEVFVSGGRKSDPGPGKKTYETLTSVDCTNHGNSDHVNNGLVTGHRETSAVKHIDENTLLFNSNEMSKPAQVKEQSVTAKEDHLYNVLKSEECANDYENPRADDMQDHTYIELNNRETKDCKEQGHSKRYEFNDRTSDCHDYFVLGDEIKGLPTDITQKANEALGFNLHTTEISEVDPHSGDHAYFTLQKIGQSECANLDAEEHGEDSESENQTDKHAYHTLERI